MRAPARYALLEVATGGLCVGHARVSLHRVDWGKPVVGRYEFAEPQLTPNRIYLDTGAYRTGVLTALLMEDRTIIQAHRATDT